MIDTLHAAIAVGVVGAGDDFANTKNLINSVRKLRAELETAVREDTARASPKVMYRLKRTLAMPSAVNSATVTANMSARRLKPPVQTNMKELPRGVTGSGPK